MRNKGSASDDEDEGELIVLKSLKDPQSTSTKPNEIDDMEA
jgi:hypothetical protein